MMMRSLCHTANILFSRPRGQNCRGDDAGAGAGALRYTTRARLERSAVTLRRAQTAAPSHASGTSSRVRSPAPSTPHARATRGLPGAMVAVGQLPPTCAAHTDARRMRDAQSHHDDDQRTKDVTTRDLHDTPRTARPRVRHLDMRLCQRPRSPSLTPQTGQEPGNGLLEHPFTRLTRPRPSTSVS